MIDVAWRQFEPDAAVHCNQTRKELECLNGYFNDWRFFDQWNSWRKRYSSSLKLITLASESEVWRFGRGWVRGFQMRLWFGEPHSFKSGFVDSMWHKANFGMKPSTPTRG